MDEVPRNMNRIVQFWDTAFKPGQDNDYSVCVTAGSFPGGYLILDVWQEKVDFPDLEDAAKALYYQWMPERINVEDAASGTSLVQTFRKETKLPIFGIPPQGDKVSRAHSVTGLLESGRVFLPAGAPWVPEFLKETSQFPSGTYDDQVDAFVGVLTELRRDQPPPAQVHSRLGGTFVEPNPLGIDLSDRKYRDTDRIG